MPSAEIITIGTEILLGEILDTNARYLALRLRAAGIDLYRKTTVGDNASRIAQAIREALERCEIIITTGGLGPTVDDPTREAVALAMGVEIEYRPELWEQIQSRFRRYNRAPTENNRRQAYIPAGAIVIENPVGTAPSFIVEAGSRCIISLPGVPREMEHLLENAVLPYLNQHYQTQSIIKTRILHTAGAGESQIDDRIGDLERLSNPTVGLAAHSGQVDVRITVKASSETEADALIEPLEAELRQRLRRWIYGVDADTLERAALQALSRQGWDMAVVEAGLKGELIQQLAGYGLPFRGGELLNPVPDPDALQSLAEAYRKSLGAQVGLGVALYPGPEKQEIAIVLITPAGIQHYSRSYGGPPDYGPRYAANHSLDLVRNLP